MIKKIYKASIKYLYTNFNLIKYNYNGEKITYELNFQNIIFEVHGYNAQIWALTLLLPVWCSCQCECIAC